MSTIVTYIVFYKYIWNTKVSKIMRPNVNQQTVIWNCKNRNMQKICKKNLGPTGMYGVVSKILMPCQTFQFKDESSPKSISSNMQIHLSLKNSRNIFTNLEMMYTGVSTWMCIMQLLVDFNFLDFLVIAT